MKIFFALIFLCSTFLYLSANTDRDIKNQVNYLSNKKKLERKIDKKFKNLASQILNRISNLKKLKIKINELDQSMASSEEDVKTKKVTLKNLLNTNQEFLKEKKDLEAKMINVIANNFSYYLISNKDYIDTEDSILINEIIKKMNIIIKKKFVVLAQNYTKVNKNIATHQSEIKRLESDIKSLRLKKIKLVVLIKKRKSTIKILATEKARYKKQLNRLSSEKKSIRATLEKLKILKKSEELKTKTLTYKRKYKNSDKLKVRQIGSSYQSARVRKYRGRKTIAPLSSFLVKRKFGNYIDPIYNIKIFNESVVLRSKFSNAKVKNVLNGKVVFAKDTAVLDKVVIVENSNGIHTIYAHLSQIAPTIVVGKKILKGYVIGRVKSELTFEVTQKNYHINPLDLIALSN